MKLLITLLLALGICFANGGQDDKGFKKYYQGYQQIMDGNWQQGIKLLGEMTKEFPKSKFVDDAKYWSAYATQELGEHEEASNLYVKFIETYKESNLVDDAKRNLARSVRKLDKEDQEKYEKYLDKRSPFVRATSGLYTAAPVAELRDRLNTTKEREIRERYSIATVNGRYTSRKLSEEDQLKESALMAISQRGGSKAAEKLRSIALNEDEHPRIREKAIFWYSRMNDVKTSDLQKMFDSTDDEHLREKIIFNVSQKSDKEATEMMVGILKNGGLSSRLREKALFWIGQSKPEYFESSVEDILDYTKGDDHLREKLMFTIGQSRLKNKNEYLYRFATDQDESQRIREKAIFWLGQNKGSLKQLKEVYASVESDRLREKIVFAFSQQKSDESIDYMVELLKSKTTSTKIKKKIVFWLGQSKSEKAQDAILELID